MAKPKPKTKSSEQPKPLSTEPLSKPKPTEDLSESSSSSPPVTGSPHLPKSSSSPESTSSFVSTEKKKGKLNRVTCTQRKMENIGPIQGHYPNDTGNFNHETNHADWKLYHSGTHLSVL